MMWVYIVSVRCLVLEAVTRGVGVILNFVVDRVTVELEMVYSLAGEQVGLLTIVV